MLTEKAKAYSDASIVADQRTAVVLVGNADAKVVQIKAGPLAGDIEHVTGARREASNKPTAARGSSAIVVGTRA